MAHVGQDGILLPIVNRRLAAAGKLPKAGCQPAAGYQPAPQSPASRNLPFVEHPGRVHICVPGPLSRVRGTGLTLACDNIKRCEPPGAPG